VRTGWLLGLVAVCGCATVPSGHAGVLVTARGGVQPVPLGEGMHFIPPLAYVDLYDLRGQERDEDLMAIAADGAPVEARASLVTFHIAPDELVAFDREVGPDYYKVIVKPIVRSTVRLVVASYDSFALYDMTKVRALQRRVTELAAERMRKYHVILDSVDLRTLGVTASPKLQRQILDTGALEQRVLATPQLLEIARRKGDARREDARAIAHAHELVAPTLTRAILDDEARRATDKLLTAPATTVVLGAPAHPRVEVAP
jgi:regulator of protease activity HflC (stomatin/prohibitin superfamily)